MLSHKQFFMQYRKENARFLRLFNSTKKKEPNELLEHSIFMIMLSCFIIYSTELAQKQICFQLMIFVPKIFYKPNLLWQLLKRNKQL